MRTVLPVLVVLFALLLLNCPPVFAQGSSGNPPGLEAASGPLAEVPENFHDFGEMTWDLQQQYIYGFVVKNVGTAPLEIKKVIGTCGVSIGRFNHTIPPGGQTKIPVNLSSSGCGAKGAKKSVLVLTNDKNARFVLSVSGHTR